MFEKIESIEFIGEQETIDLEIESPFHNFYANEICVSNSHSLSYSYVALQTLYLKHYYPTEFYCALLNHPKTSTDKEKDKAWLNSALLSTMTKGIKIVPPNRKSKWNWTIIDDKTIAMGYSSINGMGEIAFAELKEKKIENMTKEMFFSTKWSKFNKTCFESCLKAGLFDDWSKSREELKEIKQIKYKQTNQIDLFSGQVDTILSVADRKIKNNLNITSDQEKYSQFLEVCSLDLNMLNRISSVKEQFFQANGVQIDSAMEYEDPNKYYYFLLSNIEKRIAEWDGSTFYIITISDGSGYKKVTMNNNMYEKYHQILEKNAFYITKFTKNKKGFLAFNSQGQFRKVIA